MSFAIGILLLMVLFLSWLGTWGFKTIAYRHSLLDIPNRRSSHKVPVPRTGGLAILLGVYIGGLYLVLTGRLLIPHLFELGVCGLGIAMVGFFDDLFQLSAFLRLVIHFICVSAAVYLYVPVEHFLAAGGIALPLTAVRLLLVIGVVWLLNLYNFMDGIDGLAGMETISVALGAALLLYYGGDKQNAISLLLVLAAATIGFLIWNRPPAKVFMGDAGSSFLGFFFGIIALLTIDLTVLTLWTWAILLASFVVDSTVTLMVRILKREKFYKAHRSHAYQIMARRVQSHLKVTLGYSVLNWLFLFPLAFLSAVKPGYGFHLFIFSYALLAILCIVVGAGRTND